MDDQARDEQASFDAYLEALFGVIGHADRAVPLRDYCMGLMMPVARKSVVDLPRFSRELSVQRAAIRSNCAGLM